MTKRPSALSIGWWPSGLKSRIESRRWPKATDPSAQTPASSGPRCARASRMATTRARPWSASPGCRVQTPTMPHMSARGWARRGGSLDGPEEAVGVHTPVVAGGDGVAALVAEPAPQALVIEERDDRARQCRAVTRRYQDAGTGLPENAPHRGHVRRDDRQAGPHVVKQLVGEGYADVARRQKGQDPSPGARVIGRVLAERIPAEEIHVVEQSARAREMREAGTFPTIPD